MCSFFIMTTIVRENGSDNIVKIYAETLEQEAYDQVQKLANYPVYVDNKIRIMPDCHAGKGCTIGTTMALTNAVTPNLVGVDIGCGMLVVDLGDNPDIASKKNLMRLDRHIHMYVPSGFSIHKNPWDKFDDLNDLLCKNSCDLDRATNSIGTLGGGNHFIELNYSEKTHHYYLVIHTGSRNLGVQVCKFYQDLACKCLKEVSDTKKQVSADIIAKCKAENRAKDISRELKVALSAIPDVQINSDLAYLTGDNFKNYIHDMEIVQRYAVLNRATIARIILQKMKMQEYGRFETIHNYIDVEHMTLRKGAVSAQNGEKLIIPINMRDGSLICVGKGNEDWNCSAPHGAGRLMSRSAARNTLSMDDYKKSMENVYTTSVTVQTIDEAPMAYKPMDEIIRCIEPTVDVIDVIKPIYNFKAGEE